MILLFGKLCSYKWLTIVFVFSIFLSLINIGHFLSMRAYFHGPPPGSNFVSGQASQMVSEVTSLVGALCANFMLLTEMTSFTVVVGVNLLFATSFTADVVAIILLKNANMDEQSVAEYTKSFYKQHKVPPPFIGQIQWDLDGYCCGVSGYQDYVHDGSEYFNVPHSCCYARLRVSGQCGTHLWNFLYMFHQKYAKATMLKLERSYRHLDAIPEAQKQAIKSGDVNAFIRDKVPDMYKEKERIARENITADDNKIIRDHLLKRGRAYTKQEYDNEVNKYVLEKARKLVQNDLDQIEDVGRLAFFPMGCWDFLSLAKNSKWIGFADYRETIDKFSREIPGSLPGSILRLIFLILCAIAFNIFSFDTCFSKSTIIGGKLIKKSKKLLRRKGKHHAEKQHKQKPVHTATTLRKTENILDDDDDTDVRKLLKKKKSAAKRKHKSKLKTKLGNIFQKHENKESKSKTKSLFRTHKFLGQSESNMSDSEVPSGIRDETDVFNIWSHDKFNNPKNSI